MSQTEMLAAAEAFLEFIEHAGSPAKERLGKLAELLDRLASAYHGVTQTDDLYDFIEEVNRDYQAEYKAIGGRFPELGYYANLHDPRELLAPTLTGDAIDDLIDISFEMRGVVWIWKNRSPQEAANQFRSSYRHHWGRHLLNLRSYLHEVILDRPCEPIHPP
jgi:Domain of unknown function (DUF5063)